MRMMTRRELLATMGLASFAGCRRGQPTESTVTLTVDGMI